MVPQSGEQRWRRFLFCLQPARLAAAAKYSNLIPLRTCWYDIGCKPSDSQNVYRRQYMQEQLCANYLSCCVIRSINVSLSIDIHVFKVTTDKNRRKETKEYEFNSVKQVQSSHLASCRKQNRQRWALVCRANCCKEQSSTVTVGQTCKICNNVQKM